MTPVLQRLLSSGTALVLLLTAAFTVLASTSETRAGPTPLELSLPAGFPPPVLPEGNPLTVEGVELGRHLFYEPALSADQSMACASCHVQELAFTDGRSVSVGVRGDLGIRNSQTLTNVVYNPTYGWANPVVESIEHFALSPLFGDDPVELGMSGKEGLLVERLKDSDLYVQLFAKAYPHDEDPVTVDNVIKALASFIRTMISGDSAYDRFVYQRDRDAMSESAVRGLNLFLSERTECHHCHGGFNFSGSSVHAGSGMEETAFHNTGLYNLDGKGMYPAGNRGVFDITGDPSDMGRFRAPTLRNIALTAPYFHDGSASTLEEVLAFYEAGGRVIDDGPYAGDGRRNPFKSGFVAGFTLTDQERQDLISFLESLTDYTFITDPRFSDPFKQGEGGGR